MFLSWKKYLEHFAEGWLVEGTEREQEQDMLVTGPENFPALTRLSFDDPWQDLTKEVRGRM